MRLLMKDWEGETGNETIGERLGEMACMGMRLLVKSW